MDVTAPLTKKRGENFIGSEARLRHPGHRDGRHREVQDPLPNVMTTPTPKSMVDRKRPPLLDGVSTTYQTWRTQMRLLRMITDMPVMDQGPLVVISGLAGQPQAIGLAIEPEILNQGGKPGTASAGAVTGGGEEVGAPVKSGIDVLLDALDEKNLQSAEGRAYDLNKKMMDIRQSKGETATSYVLSEIQPGTRRGKSYGLPDVIWRTGIPLLGPLAPEPARDEARHRRMPWIPGSRHGDESRGSWCGSSSPTG